MLKKTGRHYTPKIKLDRDHILGKSPCKKEKALSFAHFQCVVINPKCG